MTPAVASWTRIACESTETNRRLRQHVPCVLRKAVVLSEVRRVDAGTAFERDYAGTRTRPGRDPRNRCREGRVRGFGELRWMD